VKTLEQRFWEKVAVKDPDQCWEWTAACRTDGYGVVRIAGHLVAAHRLSWEFHYEQDVPDSLFVLHKCDNRKCVNPYHLFLGTHQDNMDDMFSKDRRQAAKGEQAGSSKLTYQQVKQIRELHNTGNYSHRQLAAMFGVLAHATIGKIVRNKRWL
jgi:hypothetical protein